MGRRKFTLRRALEPPELAQLAKLRYVTDDVPGFARRRNGKGFTYSDVRSKSITKQRTLDRIGKLVIPPAWKNVWICPHANGHIQATGRDARGRKQYIYHRRWQMAANLLKFCKLEQFGVILPKIRRAARRELTRDEFDRRQLIAGLVMLLDATSIRIGNEEYVKENSSYGLTTLRCRHVKLNGTGFEFCFRGKSGLQKRVSLKNKRLARLLAHCSKLQGSRLFQYPEPDSGRPRVIDSDDVNQYLQEISDSAFTAKDFRTWKASAFIAGRLFQFRNEDRITHKQRIMRQAVREAAEQLGNTATVCRNYYVHPGLLESYRDGTFRKMMNGFTPRSRKLLSPDEQILAHFLAQWAVQPVEQLLKDADSSAA
jgi:DNA topoisomerase-1